MVLIYFGRHKVQESLLLLENQKLNDTVDIKILAFKPKNMLLWYFSPLSNLVSGNIF